MSDTDKVPMQGSAGWVQYRVIDPLLQIAACFVLVHIGEQLRRSLARRKDVDHLPMVDAFLFAGSLGMVHGFVTLVRRCLGPVFRW